MWNGGYAPLAQRGAERGCSIVLTGSGGDEWLTVGPYFAADLMKGLDVGAFVEHIRTLQRSYNVPAALQLRAALWTFGAKPLIGSMLAGVAPRWWDRLRIRRLAASTPSWLAPGASLRKAIDDRIKVAEANPPHGFYWRGLIGALDYALISMDHEEHYELGQRAGVRLRHPYWDVDLVELLIGTPPALRNGQGKAKGLVRQDLASRFPALGFERQKKVGATSFFHSLVLSEGPELWRAAGGARTLGAMGIVDPKALNASVEKLLTGAEPRRLYQVWEVLRLERWVRSQCQ